MMFSKSNNSLIPIAFLILSFLSCDQKTKFPEKTAISSEVKTSNLEKTVNQERIILDTLIQTNNSIKITYNLATEELIALISTNNWDTLFHVNEELDKDKSSINPLKEINLLWSTNEFAGIREGCGAPCYYEVVFPFIPNERPRRYFFPYTNLDDGISLGENLIAFNGDYNTPEGYPMIKIKNLVTKKIDSLSVLPTWQSRVNMNEFIDTLFATNRFIFIGQFDEQGKLCAQNSKKIHLD